MRFYILDAVWTGANREACLAEDEIYRIGAHCVKELLRCRIVGDRQRSADQAP